MSGYRYSLTREWAFGDGLICWVMLNPSTADETVDDPTIRRVVRFSQDAGYQRLVVVNLFAARSTNPAELINMDNPVGTENDAHLDRNIGCAHAVVWAWGASIPRPLATCAEDQRFHVDHVCRLHGRAPLCLGVTKEGHPRHPLYVAAAQPLVPVNAAAT